MTSPNGWNQSAATRDLDESEMDHEKRRELNEYVDQCNRSLFYVVKYAENVEERTRDGKDKTPVSTAETEGLQNSRTTQPKKTAKAQEFLDTIKQIRMLRSEGDDEDEEITEEQSENHPSTSPFLDMVPKLTNPT